MTDIFHALLLGIVEGLTEFVPVSSTGHLILLVDILNFAAPRGNVFEIVIQLGAILAVCWAYKHKLTRIAFTFHRDPEAFAFVRNVTIAFIPSVIIGMLAYDIIRDVLFSPTVVSVMLIVGGLLIILIEKKIHVAKHHHVEDFSWKLALKIGLFQTLAMIPGTSRSGATIMGSLLLGVDRKTATEFSFFLAIPTMLGATVKSLYEEWEHITADGMVLVAVGFIAAFLTALFVVRTVIAFISKHGFTPFAYYRIVVGSVMLLLLYGW